MTERLTILFILRNIYPSNKFLTGFSEWIASLQCCNFKTLEWIQVWTLNFVLEHNRFDIMERCLRFLKYSILYLYTVSRPKLNSVIELYMCSLYLYPTAFALVHSFCKTSILYRGNLLLLVVGCENYSSKYFQRIQILYSPVVLTSLLLTILSKAKIY